MDSFGVLAPAAALVAGFAHALEPDHMAAVTTFVSRRPRPLQAAGFGLRWGAGHAAAIVAVGCVLIALRVRLPDGVARGLEFGVGAMLVGLGMWLLWSVLHERAHRLAGGAADAHPGHHHHGGRGSLWVGMAHGLAGTAPLLCAGITTYSPMRRRGVCHVKGENRYAKHFDQLPSTERPRLAHGLRRRRQAATRCRNDPKPGDPDPCAFPSCSPPVSPSTPS